MNFSFCLPSRGEYNALKKMLSSFERTTRFRDKIEFLIIVDTGNTDIIKAISGLKYSFKIQFFERPKTKDFTNDYYNWLADKTSGDHIIAFNDDTWMRTANWDAKILKTVRQYGRTIYMLDLLDTARMKYGHTFPCFPCVSRRAMCTLGWLLHPKIPIYPADRVTHQVYHGCGRVIPIRNVLIEHEHIVETDESKKEIWKLYQDWQKEIVGDVEKSIYGVPEINIGDDILKLSKVAQDDGPLRLNKLTRIMNIIKEK